MARWDKKTFKMGDDHGWSARDGYKIFVADRGAVRFDIPNDWVVVPQEDGSIKFHDRTPPDDDGTLQMSVMYLNPKVDWSGLPPLSTMLADVSRDPEEGEVLGRGEIATVRRPGVDLAWKWTRYVDPTENREAFSRIALARERTIHLLLTFAYWASEAPRMVAAWDEVLRSMRLGEYIADPLRGDVRHRVN